MTITIIILAALLSTLLCLYILSIMIKITFIDVLKNIFSYKGSEWTDSLRQIQLVLILLMSLVFFITYCAINNTFLHFKY